MNRMLFGDWLSRVVHLTSQDVEEILREQDVTHHRFGEIALELGLCQPEDIWRAWSLQLSSGPQQIDLDQIGIDTQAIDCISPELAAEHGVIPIRLLPEQAIFAASAPPTEQTISSLSAHLGRQVRFVLADAEQIHHAMDVYYTPAVPA